ncbi:extracellular solute-binding protein [Amphibiibacter pelophylacis]|uniref:Extracellular solute-binding protein n=1 Tax=Amphibiibacter pelophylacis TaxID=1799477 RepID=A0ACC6NYV7_9BURK
MKNRRTLLARAALAVTALGVTGLAGLSLPALAQSGDAVLNLYSARHYPTDQALYDNFTKTTGIKINIIQADDAGIMERLRSEGASSPADVVMMVDAARLVLADDAGLFQPLKSKVLEERIPANLRAIDKGQGSTWYGLSTRARIIVYNKIKVKPAQVATYESLADPVNKGLVCTRSGSHPYNLSLFASMDQRLGAAKTEAWLKGVVANMARDPKGGDTDQIKAVASGECGVALTNSYYLARLMNSKNPEDIAVAEKVGVVFPDQQGLGTHQNIAGAALARYAKHRDNAVKFMEYLSTPPAQIYFANGNNEYPAATGVKASNPALEALGDFRRELIPLASIASRTREVQQMLDRVGYK